MSSFERGANNNAAQQLTITLCNAHCVEQKNSAVFRRAGIMRVGSVVAERKTMQPAFVRATVRETSTTNTHLLTQTEIANLLQNTSVIETKRFTLIIRFDYSFCEKGPLKTKTNSLQRM